MSFLKDSFEAIRNILESESLDDKTIRNAFSLFGTAGVIVVAGISITNLPVILKVALPASVMGLYWLWFVSKKKSSEWVYSFADSFYYMGFIYTLVSLLVAFLVGYLGTSGRLEAGPLIGNLGIALSTTIFGLAVRVFYVSFEPDLEANQKELQRSLIDSSLTLSDRVRSIGLILEFLEKEYFSNLGKKTDSLNKSLSETGSETDSLRAKLNQTSEALSKIILENQALSQSISEFSAKTDNAAIKIGQLGDKTSNLNSAQEGLADTFIRAAAKLNGLFEESSKRVNEELTESFATLNRSFEEFVQNYIDSTIEPYKAHGEIANSLKDELLKLSESHKEASKALDTSTDTLKSTVSTFNEVVDGSTEAWKLQKSELEKIAKAMSSINQSVAQLSENIGQTSNIGPQIAAVITGLQNFKSALDSVESFNLKAAEQAAIERIETASIACENSIRELASFAKQLERYGNETTNMIRMTQRALVDNLDRFTDTTQ